MQALLLVAEHGGPTMFARIGVMRALHRHEPKAAPVPRRKSVKLTGSFDKPGFDALVAAQGCHLVPAGGQDGQAD